MKHAKKEYIEIVDASLPDAEVDVLENADADDAVEARADHAAMNIEEAQELDVAAEPENPEGDEPAGTEGEEETQALEESEEFEEEIEEAESAAEDTPAEPEESPEEQEEKRRRRDKLKKNIGITLASIVGAIAVTWGAGCLFFSAHMWPNATFDGQDISLKNKEQVVQVLDGLAAGYHLTVEGNEFQAELTAEDIAFSYDSQGAVDDIFGEREVYAWPVEIFKEHAFTQVQRGSIDEERLNEILLPQLESHNESASHTVNAHLGYNEESGKIEVIPEQYGTYMLPEAAMAKITMAARSMQRTAELGRDEVEQPSVLSNDAILNANVDTANQITQASIDLKVGDETVQTIDRKQLVDWIEFNEEDVVVLNEGRMEQWARDFASARNTLHSERHYTRADGKEITVPPGYYGWEIDVDEFVDRFLEAVETNTEGEIEVPCSATAKVFPDSGGRDWGNRYIDIDLSEQYARFYGDDGSIIWETAIVSGSPEGIHNTPVGVWFIEQKQSPSKLIGYENGKKIYETWVTFWMPFIDNGVGLHDATWQYAFGGSRYAEGFGSHGCVNISYSAAEELYSIIEVGDVVITHY